MYPIKSSVKGRPRGESADHQSLLPRAQRDAKREWMKLRFGCVQGHVHIADRLEADRAIADWSRDDPAIMLRKSVLDNYTQLKKEK